MSGDAAIAAIAFAVGYVAGSIPFGLLFARLAGAGDIRQQGSGNIGATNVLRSGHKAAAAATLLFDAAKGAIPFLIARHYYGDIAAVAAGVGAFLGHLFPVWLGFKGGKGLATFFGIIFAMCWQAGLLAGATWLAAAMISRRSSVGALAVSATAWLWIILWAWVSWKPPQAEDWQWLDLRYPLFSLTAAVLGALMIWTHRSNIARLRAGTEPRIGAK